MNPVLTPSPFSTPYNTPSGNIWRFSSVALIRQRWLPRSPLLHHTPNRKRVPHDFRLYRLTELFGPVGVGIFKGSIHALNVEYPGPVPVVSSRTDDNGILGYYDLGPKWPRFRNVITVASNGTPLTSYYHPYQVVPKDDVFVCKTPADFPVETIFYVITALNSVTWRFSYYRKAYLNKLDKIGIYMPVNESDEIDHDWLRQVAESCDGWKQLGVAMPTWQPAPFVSLGRRTRSMVVIEPDNFEPDDRMKIDADPEDALRAMLRPPHQG